MLSQGLTHDNVMSDDSMSDDIDQQQAMILLERAYRHQMKGELADKRRGK